MNSRQDGIQIGDSVVVHFSTRPPQQGKVLHIASATGDSWIIKTEASVVHIQQFDFIEKLDSGVELPEKYSITWLTS